MVGLITLGGSAPGAPLPWVFCQLPIACICPTCAVADKEKLEKQGRQRSVRTKSGNEGQLQKGWHKHVEVELQLLIWRSVGKGSIELQHLLLFLFSVVAP